MGIKLHELLEAAVLDDTDLLHLRTVAGLDKKIYFDNFKKTDEIRARDAGGLGLYDDSGENGILVEDGGGVSLIGTGKRDLTIRPDLDFTNIAALGKPTQVTIGAFRGYSMPLYAADEELFFSENVPGRWDGESDIELDVLVALALAETPGEQFKFQLSWNQVGPTDIVPAATHDVTDEITVVDGTQYATYMLTFVIDYNIDAGDVILPHDALSGRLRRVAATGDEVDGEIIVLDWHNHFIVDKMFKAL